MSASKPLVLVAAKRNPETENTYCVGPACDHLDIARHLYRAMCERYPDRQITLYDGSGRILEKTSFCEMLLGIHGDVCSS